MDCRQAESWLALWVGNDLEDGTEAGALQGHLETCPHCRQLSHELVVAQTALQEARCTPVVAATLWPRVKARLTEWERRPQFAKFNVWVPTAIATVACGLMVMVATVEVQRKVQGWTSTPRVTSSSLSLVVDPQTRSQRTALKLRNDFAPWPLQEFRSIQSVVGPAKPVDPTKPVDDDGF